ncbi:rRNA maturation RNase YbeY [Hydrogenovibrio sp. SC-1]|uniref:rRNA maturation RNase YbeY n=1 Tax=Hydrogenovibrio sp. SC-1 TaxID=2065820 RepID=UPI000C7A1656|nr:rRNA maturation RNase YbeY [Hydrogenovibrio sp. SC-1]PLA75075.1 rRNA maturation RNase YbeY [Hydrogenovibrio sp. SC-1]
MIHLNYQIAVSDEQAKALPTEAEMLNWIDAAMLDDRRDGETEIALRVVEPEEIQMLNRDYRGKDKVTNVLSFPFEMPPGLVDLGEELPYLGDLVICAAQVAQEAIDQQKSLKAHWAHMVIHGCLHLQGYDHIDDDEANEMETLEVDILAELGFLSPYEN